MEQHSTPPAHRFLVQGLVVVAMVVAIGSSLGAPLVPLLAGVEHVPLGEAQWSVTLPFLVSAVATPAMGRLGDGPHRRALILGSLGIVLCGGVLAALPLSFTWLLVGRGLQGIGLGLIPLTIAAARDALPAPRARSAAAMLSVTVVAGIGLGYPITGLIAQYLGLHAAYWFGVVVAGGALAVAAGVVPSSGHRPSIRLDVAGALALGAALACLLLAISEGEDWGWSSGRLIGLLVGALVLLIGWVLLELFVSHPLVNLRLLRQGGVSTASVITVLAGIGMYLLMSLATRLVETPVSTGYGFGGAAVAAGLMLVPFSAGSVAANRIALALSRRTSPGLVLLLGSVALVAGMAVFSLARDGLWEIAVVMGVAGLGVGAVFAVVPGLIVQAVPPNETGSAMSFNQVLRYVGYGLGSTLSAVILQLRTPAGQALPSSAGYTVGGLVSCAIWLLAAVAGLAAIRRHVRDASSAAPATETATPGLEAPAGDTTAPATPALRRDEERASTNREI